MTGQVLSDVSRVHSGLTFEGRNEALMQLTHISPAMQPVPCKQRLTVVEGLITTDDAVWTLTKRILHVLHLTNLYYDATIMVLQCGLQTVAVATNVIASVQT